jgi:hypothetical protein
MQVILGGLTTLPGTGVTRKMAIETTFVSTAAFRACMADYHFLPLGDLIALPAYEKVREDMRTSGNNSWEQMTNWTILRPSPELIYVISWVGAAGAATYTVSEYYLKAGGGFALRAANSFLIVPRKFIECAGIDQRLCTVTIQ